MTRIKKFRRLTKKIPVRVYTDDKVFYFATNEQVKYESNTSFIFIEGASNAAFIEKKYVEAMNDDTHSKIIYIHKDVKLLFAYFKSIFQVIEAGGGLVKNKKGKYLFIFRNGKWDLPKGKREKGETIKKCAVREVKEECGIKGLKIVRQLPTTYHIYSLEEKQVLKPTHWFEMTCDDTSSV